MLTILVCEGDLRILHADFSDIFVTASLTMAK